MEDEPKGRAKGGVARRDALSQERRSQIASKAATARWGARASHKGNFKDEFGIDVECYVLDDDQKTAVVSQRGMSAALGLKVTGGSTLTRFLSGDKIEPYVGDELWERISNPIIFQWYSPGSNQLAQKTYGYDVTILIDVCKAILKAADEGKLLDRQKRIVRQAHIILNASAKAGIKGLVYALAGYDATRAEVIAAFKGFVREEAREYEKEFPDQLYNEWYRLYEIPRPVRNKPWKFKDLTVKQVYNPLARSNGRILELTRNKRASSTSGKSKLHQFLSEIGVKALRTHLGQLLGIAQISDNRAQYEKHFEKIFGSQQSLEFKSSDS